MGNPIFKGSAVALVTPMHSDGSVNYEVLGELIEFQIANGTDAIVACGTTGEAATLSEKEHCEVLSFVAEKVNGRIPVIAGTGSNDTATAVMLSKSAHQYGADAILCVTPYYNKTSQTGLIKHFIMFRQEPAATLSQKHMPSFASTKILLLQKKQTAIFLPFLRQDPCAETILTFIQEMTIRQFHLCHWVVLV